MTDYFNQLLGLEFPFWVYIAIPAAVLIVIFLIIWFIFTGVFKLRLRKIIKAKDESIADEAILNFKRHYPAKKLVRYSARMERYSRKLGSHIIQNTGLSEKWVQKLAASKFLRAADLRRVLLYCPPSYLFKAFLAAGKNTNLNKFFKNWVNGEGEEKVIRLLAETCRGEDFDPAFGKSFLDNHSELLRELTGEPEWYSRYFAYKILLADKNDLTARIMEDGFKDPHPLIRKIITENISFDREKTWALLWDKLIHDPVYEVREAARKRIAKEFTDIYSPKDAELTGDETARVLELLDPTCQEDRIFAMNSLENSNNMLKFPAASFLDKCGLLGTLLSKNTLDDPVNIEHSVSVLQKALDINVSGFLIDYPQGDGAPLLAASRLLSGLYSERIKDVKFGTQEQICILAKKVFAFFNSRKIDPSTKEIYLNTLKAITYNGNVKSFEIFSDELSARENDPVYTELLLQNVPMQAQSVMIPVLFRFLENTGFSLREDLVQLLGSFNADSVLPKIFEILNGNRLNHPHIVRISALKILGLLDLPFCIMRILESLPTIKTEEIEEFGKLILRYPQEVFEEKARVLLTSPDARVRSSLITILPVIKNDSFMKDIRASLKDVDPDVRIASIKALLGFGEIKLLNQETSMLRDPVERVRFATAEVIAIHGNAAAIEVLKTITFDPNETDTVKIGILNGLGQAKGAEGIPILVSVLDSIEEFKNYAINALAMRTARKDITQLIDIFKDAEPPLREKLIPVFRAMGRKAEPQVIEILKDEVASFKPYLVKILEETGYIDETKRRLSNRKAETRREAAMLLSLIGTLPAFRGLVLAAKDPDQEVRVCVVKALEKLKSAESKDLLDKLKEDPDNRVRKYTYWALERLDSLAME